MRTAAQALVVVSNVKQIRLGSLDTLCFSEIIALLKELRASALSKCGIVKTLLSLASVVQ